MTQNDVMQLLIGKDVGAGTPTTAVNGTIIAASDTYLLDGEMAVVNSHNKVLSATSVLTDDIVAESGIKILLRNGTHIISSDMIKQANIVGVKGVVDSAAVQQVSYIGYNTSSGSIAASNSKLYVVRVNLKEQDQTGQGQQIVLNSPYKSDASATQAEVANGLALALSNTMCRQTVKPIKVELINSTATGSTNIMDYTVTIVKGSKIVTVGTNCQYASGTELAAGDYLRFHTGVTGTHSTGDGIYKVVTIDSTTQFTVDRPIEESSQSMTHVHSHAEVLPAATANAANFGIKLTGIARTFSLPIYRNSIVSFTVGLDSTLAFGATKVSYTTAASLGNGTYAQIAQLEWDLQGNRGNPYRGDSLYVTPTALASTTATYDQISITYFADPNTGGVGGTPRRMKQLLLAFATGFLTTEAPDIVHDVLEAYTTQDCVIGT
jgi:hypothetical protein